MNVSSYKKFIKNIYGRKFYLFCCAFVLMSSALAFTHPIWIISASMFLCVCDMLIASYYPLTQDDAKTQNGIIMVSSSRKNSLAGILPSNRQLMMKAAFSERLILLIIYTLGCIGAAIRLMFFGMDCPVWEAVGLAFIGALQLTAMSAFYAFDSAGLRSVAKITSGFSTLLIMIPAIAGLLNETQTMQTSIYGGLAMIGFTLLALFLSVLTHRKRISDSENTAYNGEKIINRLKEV